MVVVSVGPPGFQRVCRADEPAVRTRVGLAVHTEVGLALLTPNAEGGGGTPAMAGYGIGVGYDAAPHLSIETTLSRTMPGSRAVVAPGGGPEFFETTVGTLWRSLVHDRVRGDGSSWLVGAGPTLVFGGNYGTVPLLHLEVGYEWRTRWGLTLLLAGQAMEPLATSRPEIDPARCYTADCPSRFDPSQPVLGSRAALGFVF